MANSKGVFKPPVLVVSIHPSKPTLFLFLSDSVPWEIAFGTVSAGLPCPLAFMWDWTIKVRL